MLAMDYTPKTEPRSKSTPGRGGTLNATQGGKTQWDEDGHTAET